MRRDTSSNCRDSRVTAVTARDDARFFRGGTKRNLAQRQGGASEPVGSEAPPCLAVRKR